MSGTSKADEKALRGMLSDLRHFRSELDFAVSQGDQFVANNAQQLIRILHARIRRHCEATEHSLPHDVPETDGGE